MTKPDLDDFAETPSDGAIILRRAVIGIGGGIVLIFMAGMIAGLLSSVIENGGMNIKAAGILWVMLMVVGSIAYGMWRLWPEASNEPVAPRIRNARRILIASLALGAPLGFMLGVADEGTAEFFSEAPVRPSIAAAVIAVWLIVAPLLSWLWWRQIDEHEAGAYRDGGLIAVHAYLFVTPAWWMATRAGWLPPQEPMLVLLGVCLVWSLVWFVRRYF
jgi:hypothetical protein